MRRRVKVIALAAENAGVSPFLPLAAGLILTLFTISLAMAEPRSNTSVMASHDATANLALSDGGLASDSLPAEGAVISSRPLYPPRHPDRYEFYHRYDYGLTSRYRPNEDGAR